MIQSFVKLKNEDTMAKERTVNRPSGKSGAAKTAARTTPVAKPTAAPRRAARKVASTARPVKAGDTLDRVTPATVERDRGARRASTTTTVQAAVVSDLLAADAAAGTPIRTPPSN